MALGPQFLPYNKKLEMLLLAILCVDSNCYLNFERNSVNLSKLLRASGTTHIRSYGSVRSDTFLFSFPKSESGLVFTIVCLQSSS